MTIISEKTKCSEAGCAFPVLARKLCQKHYDQRKHRGEFEKKLVDRRPISERFWEHLIFTSEGCWMWRKIQPSFVADYPKTTETGRTVFIHRWSYKKFVKPIPTGLEIDHLCRNIRCVNPSHLEAVTSATNTLRGVGVCAKNKRKSSCPKGHPYSKENTRILLDKKGRQGRWCRECTKQDSRDRWAAKRETYASHSFSSNQALAEKEEEKPE